MAEIEIPAEWAPAAAGEEEIDYVLYDTVASGTTPSAKLTFFNHDEATDGIQVTNMAIKGQLAATQRFLIKSIEVITSGTATASDAAKVMERAILDLKVGGERVLCIPAIRLSAPIAGAQTRTADVGGTISYEPFKLDKAIVVKGAVPLAVEFHVGVTAPAATVPITVLLHGRLVKPA